MDRKANIPDELVAEMTPAVRAFVESLLYRIDELERRLGQNPTNSSLPPSTQHPHEKPTPKPKKSKRKRGGQPGHPRHERALVPPEQLSETIPLRPPNCRRCGESLAGTDPDPIRHQVWELPPIEPIITEYQQHRLTCVGCGTITCGVGPALTY